MKILSKYILKEHAGPFFFSLAVIMFVFITKFIAQYIGKIFGKGLSYGTILEFIYLNLAWMLALAVPMSVLVASLMAFGRLSADNEITILKTSGISLYQIIRPVMAAAIIITLIMIWYNDSVLPEFNHRARLLYYSISQKKPTLQLEEGIYLNLNNFNILVEDVERGGSTALEKGDIFAPEYPEDKNVDKLRNITIFDVSSSELQRTVVAKFGYMVFNKEREQLIFTLFDGEIHEINNKDFSEYRRLQFKRNVFYIPAPELVFKKSTDTWRGDREMTIAMMRDKIRQAKNIIEKENTKIRNTLKNYFPAPADLEFIENNENIKQSTWNWKPKDLRIARSKASRKTLGVAQQLKNARTNINFQKRQIYKYEVEIQKKFSIPFACIVFVLIGAPLGIRARKGSLGVGISFSVGFFLLYWAALIAGEELADRQLISPILAMWSPNIIVGSFGIYLTYRTVKETTFIQWERLPRFLQMFFKEETQTT